MRIVINIQPDMNDKDVKWCLAVMTQCVQEYRADGETGASLELADPYGRALSVEIAGVIDEEESPGYDDIREFRLIRPLELPEIS